jgi:hypothetical protein
MLDERSVGWFTLVHSWHYDITRSLCKQGVQSNVLHTTRISVSYCYYFTFIVTLKISCFLSSCPTSNLHNLECWGHCSDHHGKHKRRWYALLLVCVLRYCGWNSSSHLCCHCYCFATDFSFVLQNPRRQRSGRRTQKRCRAHGDAAQCGSVFERQTIKRTSCTTRQVSTIDHVDQLLYSR